MRLHRDIVRDQRDEPRFGDPVQQPLIAAVEPGAGISLQHLGVGVLVHAEDDPVVAGAQTDEVALLDLDLIGLHDAHQLVVADIFLAAPEMRFEVDHDAAALHALAAILSIDSAVAPRWPPARSIIFPSRYS